LDIERLFSAEITDEIKLLAINRLLDGGNLAPRGCDRRKAKLALLIVIETNPREVLTRAERAILYGVSEDRLREGNVEIHNAVNL